MGEWRKVDRDISDALGEGTLWSARENAVYWTDILAPALNRLSLDDGAIQRWAMPEPIGWVAERAGTSSAASRAASPGSRSIRWSSSRWAIPNRICPAAA